MNQKAKILDIVERHKYVRQGMIRQALGMKERTVQHALQMLAANKLLYRFRLDSREQYIYHIDKTRSVKWRHWLAVNEFHFALKRRLQPGQKILYYQFEFRHPYGQADGLYVVQTKKDGGILFFLEADDGANQFDKVEKYEQCYMSRQWVNEPWADPLDKGIAAFPMVVVVTPRVKEIQKLAAKADKVRWLVFGDPVSAVKSIL